MSTNEEKIAAIADAIVNYSPRSSNVDIKESIRRLINAEKLQTEQEGATVDELIKHLFDLHKNAEQRPYVILILNNLHKGEVLDIDQAYKVLKPKNSYLKSQQSFRRLPLSPLPIRRGGTRKHKKRSKKTRRVKRRVH
jgi:hypothetical protein